MADSTKWEAIEVGNETWDPVHESSDATLDAIWNGKPSVSLVFREGDEIRDARLRFRWRPKNGHLPTQVMVVIYESDLPDTSHEIVGEDLGGEPLVEKVVGPFYTHKHAVAYAEAHPEITWDAVPYEPVR